MLFASSVVPIEKRLGARTCRHTYRLTGTSDKRLWALNHLNKLHTRNRRGNSVRKHMCEKSKRAFQACVNGSSSRWRRPSHGTTVNRHMQRPLGPPPVAIMSLPLPCETSYYDYNPAAIVHFMKFYMYSSQIRSVLSIPSEGRTTWVRRCCNLAKGVDVASVPPGV
jgi:hypothetical protein